MLSDTSTHSLTCVTIAPEGFSRFTTEPLGAGWVAGEALAIALYCALAGGSAREALQLAANHPGNSDSTGAVCGNLLGAYHGDVGLPTD